MLISFRLVLQWEVGKDIQESSRLEFLEKVLANNFAFSNAEGNICILLNRGGIVDLPLLRTLLAICQMCQGPSFWEVINSFVLVAYASLAASTTLLQWLLACLNFILDSEDVFCCYKWKKMFSMNYGSSTSCWKPWRWVRFDLILTMRSIYICSTLNSFTKFTSRCRSLSPMEHLLHKHKDHPNQHKNSHKPCNEMGYPVLSLLESQWKLRQ